MRAALLLDSDVAADALVATLRLRTALVAGLVFAALCAASPTWAYFHVASTGHGSAAVGTPEALKVGVVAPGDVALYPGGASEGLTIHVANPSSGRIAISEETLALATDGSGDAIDGLTGKPIAGCRAAWFTVTQPVQSSYSIAGGGSQDITGGAAALTESNTDQTACAGSTPGITATVS